MHQLALALAAFAAPHTTPEEDVELLLGQAAGGGASLLQVRLFGQAGPGCLAGLAGPGCLAGLAGQHCARRAAGGGQRVGRMA